MMVSVTTDLDLTTFKALSFDCYGTLIDWEAGLGAVLVPWAREQGLDQTDEELLLAYADHEAAVQEETPGALYPDVLAAAFRRTGDGLLPRTYRLTCHRCRASGNQIRQPRQSSFWR